MGRINIGRVVLGGILAGIVINVSEFVLNGVILMDEYQEALATYGLTEASWAMVGYIVTAFVLGFVAAWLYAALRPRFGPGWQTGALAGLVVWVAAYLVPGVWMTGMGMTMGGGAMLLSLVWGIVEMALAGMAAGWLYQEAGEAPAAATATPGGTPPL